MLRASLVIDEWCSCGTCCCWKVLRQSKSDTCGAVSHVLLLLIVLTETACPGWLLPSLQAEQSHCWEPLHIESNQVEECVAKTTWAAGWAGQSKTVKNGE